MPKTMMEKYQNALLEKNKGKSLNETVNQMHKLLSSAGSGGNENIAIQASQFLTWLLFGNYSNDFLTEAYRQELLKDPQILSAVNRINQYADESIKIGELGELYRTTGDNSIMSQIGKFNYQRGINTEEDLVKIINQFITEDTLKIKQSGTDQMTVWFPVWLNGIFKNTTEEIDKELNGMIKQGKRLRFSYKDVKIDTMSNTAKAEINFSVEDSSIQQSLQAVYTVLSSASIKSKNKLSKIDLEDTTIMKAYSAFINYARKKKMSQTQIKQLFTSYYQTEEIKNDPYITLHLNHLISVYALTGLGTSLKTDLNSILDGAKYLIAIDNINKQVVIHSTNKIINEILLKNTYSKHLVSKINLNLNRI